jgi:hypothetical protein
MRRTLSALAALTLGAPVALAAQGVSVGGFETDGSVGLTRDEYQAIGRALGSLLSGTLDSDGATRVVAIAAAPARQAGRIDIATARARASAAGARLLVVGSLLDQYGDIQLEARIIDAASGKAIAVVRGDPALDKREQLAEAIVALANRLMAEPGIGGSADVSPSGGVPVAALIAYGQGIGHEAAGDKAAAATAFRAAIAAAPNFSEAATALKRVGG